MKNCAARGMVIPSIRDAEISRKEIIMKSYYSRYLSSKDWLIEEKEWRKNLQQVRETQFTIGNGSLCSRGVLEEIPYDSYPGTYIAGLYDKVAAQVPELVNLPNPVNFKIMSEGEKIDMVGTDVVQHQRILDLQKGTLFRKTIFSDFKKRKYDYQSMRFISMENKNLGVMKIWFKAVDAPANISIMGGVDTGVTNRGVLTEGRKKHFEITEVQTKKNINYLNVETFGRGVEVSYATALKVSIGGKNYWENKKSFNISLKKGQTVTFTLFFVICSGQGSVKNNSLSLIRDAMKAGFNTVWQQNVKAWQKEWNIAAVDILGDPEVEKAMRFNIYHLLICSPENKRSVSVGARSLSGEGYRGHIFWDADIFILPFYIYTNPIAARNMLLYRYDRLDAARQIAKERGYRGTMFPWESAHTGFDVTPTWYKNLDGSIIKILTMEREHHITADIAYGVYQYYRITDDINFFLRYGLEMFMECARFWSSRLEYNKRKDVYEIKHVIGPNEFQEDVNNSAYTNTMAQWNIKMGVVLYKSFKKRYPAQIKILGERIGLKIDEVRKWQSKAEKIKNTAFEKNKVIEEFDGYFRKKTIQITELNEHLMPVIPKSVKLAEISKTQFVKQADVVMLLYLLGDQFDAETKKVNFNYYNKRTLHKSSLSPSMHAIVGLEAGEVERSYQYFVNSANTDIDDIHGNTLEGIHSASIGGTWQALINGFAGVRIIKGELSVNPKLPVQWRRLTFKFVWRSSIVSVVAYQKKIRIRIKSKKIKSVSMKIYGRSIKLAANRTYLINEVTKKSKRH